MRAIESIQIMLGGRNRLQMHLVAAILTTITVLLAGVRYLQDGGFSAIVLILLASAGIFLISAFLFQTAFDKIANHLILVSGALGLFSMAFVGDGIRSEAMFWLPFVPMLAAFLTSYKSAILYTFITLMGLAVMLFQADSISVHYPALGTAVIFACSLGVFLERSRINYEDRLAELATSHPLTGLASRVLFEILLDRTAGLLGRHNIPYVLVFIDVNGLKPVNDQYGHAAGDALLREVGRRLSESVRASESLFHISGDEFSIIAEDTPNLDALKERFRSIGGEFVYLNFRIPLSVSVGATYGTIDSESSLASADSDMYLDKSSKRRWSSATSAGDDKI